MDRGPILPIHPFPARMAPEIALAEAARLPSGSVVLDPMVGSGTVLRVASEQHHRCVGFDMDPLAVLMARAWTTPVDTADLCRSGGTVADTAEGMCISAATTPWIDTDAETKAYVDFWFGAQQQADLRKLSNLLHGYAGPVGDALRVALSRLIVTKDRGASLARDVSHSRPHRTRQTNEYCVISEFRRSVRYVASRLHRQPPAGSVAIALGDARRLLGVSDCSIDAVITSPPYLNAIDYMRGHRLALVWLGYTLGELRAIRSESIGAERMLAKEADAAVVEALLGQLPSVDQLPQREERVLERYALDIICMMAELQRVVRPGGTAVLVVGNSCLRGVFIENSRLVMLAAQQVGFTSVRTRERELPPNRRYLPPPSLGDASGLEKRMRTETILTLSRL